MSPIITAIRADINTAAAIISFIFFIRLFFSGDTRSHSCSIAELMLSVTSTSPMHNKMMSHSAAAISSKLPAVNAEAVLFFLHQLSLVRSSLLNSTSDPSACMAICPSVAVQS